MTLTTKLRRKIDFAKELRGELRSLHETLSVNDGSPIPVKLWRPEYYTSPLEEVFGGDGILRVDPDLYRRAERVVDLLFYRGINCHDPDGIMKIYGQGASVRVSNHHDFTDPPVLARAYDHLGAQASWFAAMAELSDERRPLIADRIARLGTFPVDRALLKAGNPSTVKRFFKTGRYLLDSGEAVTILPQGAITEASKNGIVEGVNDGAIKIARKGSKINEGGDKVSDSRPIIVLAVHGNTHVLSNTLAGIGSRATVLVHEVFEPGNLPTVERLQDSMQIAVQRASQYHTRERRIFGFYLN